MHLTENEMLNLWKTVMHLQPVRRECTIERTDGIDVDELLLVHIRQWYAALLQSAPLHMVPVADVKRHLTDVAVAAGGVVAVGVPPQCVRPVEWKLSGWQKSVTLFLEPSALEAAYVHSEWTRPGVCDPAAVDYGDHILLFSLPDGAQPQFDVARCVVRPTDGTYTFHSAALSTIPVWSATRIIT